jgi:type IV secretion system protein VirD4
MSSKYDITKHPNYRYLSDFNDKNRFDIEKYLSTQLKPKPDEKYDTYEVSVENDDDAVDALAVSAFS